MVKACIYNKGETCREQDSGGEDDKRERPVAISMVPTRWARE